MDLSILAENENGAAPLWKNQYVVGTVLGLGSLCALSLIALLLQYLRSR